MGKSTEGLSTGGQPGKGDGVCVSGMASASSWSRATTSGAGMSRCHQLGRMGSRGSYWADWGYECSCWRDPHCVYIYICLLTNWPHYCSREDRRMMPWMLPAFRWVLCVSLFCMASHVFMCIGIYAVTMCALCASANVEYTFSLTTSWIWGHCSHLVSLKLTYPAQYIFL